MGHKEEDKVVELLQWSRSEATVKAVTVSL